MLDQDEGASVGVGVALGVVGLLLIALVGSLAWNALDEPVPAKAPVAVAVPASAPAPSMSDAVLDIPLAGELISKVYFETGKADVAADSKGALEQAAAAAQAAPAKKVVLSGFHDLSGDPVKNAELAKERAKAVREALKALGVPADRIALRKPAQTGEGGAAEEARRVELRMVDLP